MFDVDLYGRVRLAFLGQGLSQRKAVRRFGRDRGTLATVVSHSAPPGYRRDGASSSEAGTAYLLHRAGSGRY
jgi:hypothetical protein